MLLLYSRLIWVYRFVIVFVIIMMPSLYAQMPRAPFSLEDIRRMQRLRPAHPFDRSGDYTLLEAWEMQAQRDTTSTQSKWWETAVIGKMIPLGKCWELGLDGLVDVYVGNNGVDGSILGYEVFVARHTDAGHRWVLRSAHRWALGRRRYLTDKHLLYFYAPQRSGQLVLSAGRTTRHTTHTSNEEEFAENFLTPLGANSPLHRYEKDYWGIRNSLYLTPQLRTSLQLLYEHRKPLLSSLGETYNALHTELRMAYNFSRYGSSSATYRTAYRLPRGFFAPEVGLTYRLTHYSVPSASTAVALPSAVQTGMAGHSLELSLRMAYAFSDYRRLDWAVVGESILGNSKQLQAEDYRYLSMLNALDRKPFTNVWATGEHLALSSGSWLWGRMNYGGGRLALAHIPLLKRLLMDEQLHLRGLIGSQGQRWFEGGYSLGLGNMLRLGLFYGTDWAGANAVALRCSVPLLYLTSRTSTRY